MPNKRVPPSVAMKQEVDELLSQGREGLPLSEFIRFCEATGGQLVSKSAVSELSRIWEEDFQRWRSRDLSELEPLYLFLDAFYLPLRSGTEEQEGVLCAYAIGRSGQKVLVHLALGCRESYPKRLQAELKRLIQQQVFWAAGYEEGLKRGRELIDRFGDRYPAAMECLEKDLEACLI